MKEKLIKEIQNYTPYNPQEAADQALLLKLLAGEEDLTLRSCMQAHLTASAWVVSPDRKQVLMAYHNIYNSWAWLGGHADGNWDLMAVAEKEAGEESGITGIRPLTDAVFSLEVLTVDGHEKKGKYVPSHLHLNLTYLFEGDPDAPIRIKEDENSRVGWINVDEIGEKSTEPWFIDRIYKKLTEKVNKL